MKITCIGAGPAGLYLPILMKNRDPRHDITIYERNDEGATNGWGVTYGEDFIPDLMEGDTVSAREIIDHSFRWLDTVVEIAGRRPLPWIAQHGSIEALAPRALAPLKLA